MVPPVMSKSELSAIWVTFDPDGKMFAGLAVCSPPFEESWREIATSTAVAGYPFPASLERIEKKRQRSNGAG